MDPRMDNRKGMPYQVQHGHVPQPTSDGRTMHHPSSVQAPPGFIPNYSQDQRYPYDYPTANFHQQMFPGAASSTRSAVAHHHGFPHHQKEYEYLYNQMPSQNYYGSAEDPRVPPSIPYSSSSSQPNVTINPVLPPNNNSNMMEQGPGQKHSYIPAHSRPPETNNRPTNDFSGSSSSYGRSLELTRVGPPRTLSSISVQEDTPIAIMSRINTAVHSEPPELLRLNHYQSPVEMSYSSEQSSRLTPHYSQKSHIMSGSGSLTPPVVHRHRRPSHSSLNSSKLGSSSRHPPTLIKAEEPTTLSAAHLISQHSRRQSSHAHESATSHPQRRFETATAPVPYAVAKQSDDPYFAKKLEESYASIKKIENPFASGRFHQVESSSRACLQQDQIDVVAPRKETFIAAHDPRRQHPRNLSQPDTENRMVKAPRSSQTKDEFALDLSVKTVRQLADSTEREPDIIELKPPPSSRTRCAEFPSSSNSPNSTTRRVTPLSFYDVDKVTSLQPSINSSAVESSRSLQMGYQDFNGIPNLSTTFNTTISKRPVEEASTWESSSKVPKFDSHPLAHVASSFEEGSSYYWPRNSGNTDTKSVRHDENNRHNSNAIYSSFVGMSNTSAIENKGCRDLNEKWLLPKDTELLNAGFCQTSASQETSSPVEILNLDDHSGKFANNPTFGASLASQEYRPNISVYNDVKTLESDPDISITKIDIDSSRSLSVLTSAAEKVQRTEVSIHASGTEDKSQRSLSEMSHSISDNIQHAVNSSLLNKLGRQYSTAPQTSNQFTESEAKKPSISPLLDLQRASKSLPSSNQESPDTSSNHGLSLSQENPSKFEKVASTLTIEAKGRSDGEPLSTSNLNAKNAQSSTDSPSNTEYHGISVSQIEKNSSECDLQGDVSVQLSQDNKTIKNSDEDRPCSENKELNLKSIEIESDVKVSLEKLVDVSEEPREGSWKEMKPTEVSESTGNKVETLSVNDKVHLISESVNISGTSAKNMSVNLDDGTSVMREETEQSATKNETDFDKTKLVQGNMNAKSPSKNNEETTSFSATLTLNSSSSAVSDVTPTYGGKSEYAKEKLPENQKKDIVSDALESTSSKNVSECGERLISILQQQDTVPSTSDSIVTSPREMEVKKEEHKIDLIVDLKEKKNSDSKLPETTQKSEVIKNKPENSLIISDSSLTTESNSRADQEDLCRNSSIKCEEKTPQSADSIEDNLPKSTEDKSPIIKNEVQSSEIGARTEVTATSSSFSSVLSNNLEKSGLSDNELKITYNASSPNIFKDRLLQQVGHRSRNVSRDDKYDQTKSEGSKVEEKELQVLSRESRSPHKEVVLSSHLPLKKQKETIKELILTNETTSNPKGQDESNCLESNVHQKGLESKLPNYAHKIMKGSESSAMLMKADEPVLIKDGDVLPQDSIDCSIIRINRCEREVEKTMPELIMLSDAFTPSTNSSEIARPLQYGGFPDEELVIEQRLNPNYVSSSASLDPYGTRGFSLNSSDVSSNSKGRQQHPSLPTPPPPPATSRENPRSSQSPYSTNPSPFSYPHPSTPSQSPLEKKPNSGLKRPSSATSARYANSPLSPTVPPSTHQIDPNYPHYYYSPKPTQGASSIPHYHVSRDPVQRISPAQKQKMASVNPYFSSQNATSLPYAVQGSHEEHYSAYSASHPNQKPNNLSNSMFSSYKDYFSAYGSYQSDNRNNTMLHSLPKYSAQDPAVSTSPVLSRMGSSPSGNVNSGYFQENYGLPSKKQLASKQVGSSRLTQAPLKGSSSTTNFMANSPNLSSYHHHHQYYSAMKSQAHWPGYSKPDSASSSQNSMYPYPQHSTSVRKDPRRLSQDQPAQKTGGLLGGSMVEVDMSRRNFGGRNSVPKSSQYISETKKLNPQSQSAVNSRHYDMKSPYSWNSRQVVDGSPMNLSHHSANVQTQERPASNSYENPVSHSAHSSLSYQPDALQTKSYLHNPVNVSPRGIPHSDITSGNYLISTASPTKSTQSLPYNVKSSAASYNYPYPTKSTGYSNQHYMKEHLNQQRHQHQGQVLGGAVQQEPQRATRVQDQMDYRSKHFKPVKSNYGNVQSSADTSNYMHPYQLNASGPTVRPNAEMTSVSSIPCSNKYGPAHSSYSSSGMPHQPPNARFQGAPLEQRFNPPSAHRNHQSNFSHSASLLPKVRCEPRSVAPPSAHQNQAVYRFPTPNQSQARPSMTQRPLNSVASSTSLTNVTPQPITFSKPASSANSNVTTSYSTGNSSYPSSNYPNIYKHSTRYAPPLSATPRGRPPLHPYGQPAGVSLHHLPRPKVDSKISSAGLFDSHQRYAPSGLHSPGSLVNDHHRSSTIQYNETQIQDGPFDCRKTVNSVMKEQVPCEDSISSLSSAGAVNLTCGKSVQISAKSSSSKSSIIRVDYGTTSSYVGTQIPVVGNEKLDKPALKTEVDECKLSSREETLDLKFDKLLDDLAAHKESVTSRKSKLLERRYNQKIVMQRAVDNDQIVLPDSFMHDEEDAEDGEDSLSENNEPIKKFRGKFKSIKDKAVERVILTYASHSDESATEMIPDDDASDFEEELIKEIKAKSRKSKTGSKLKEVKKTPHRSDRKDSSTRSSKKKSFLTTRKSRQKDFSRVSPRRSSSSSSSSYSLSSQSSASSDGDTDADSGDSLSSGENVRSRRTKRSGRKRNAARGRRSSSTSSNSDDDFVPNRRAGNKKKMKKRSRSTDDDDVSASEGAKTKLKSGSSDEGSGDLPIKGGSMRKFHHGGRMRGKLWRKRPPQHKPIVSDSEDDDTKQIAHSSSNTKRERLSETDDADDPNTSTKSRPLKKRILDLKENAAFSPDSQSRLERIKEIELISTLLDNEELIRRHDNDSVLLKLKRMKTEEEQCKDALEMNKWKTLVSAETKKLFSNLHENKWKNNWRKPVFGSGNDFKKNWQKDMKKYKISTARVPKALVVCSMIQSQTSSSDELKKTSPPVSKKNKKLNNSLKSKGKALPNSVKSKSGIVKTSLTVPDNRADFKVAPRPEISNVMERFFEKVLGPEPKKLPAFGPFTPPTRSPTGFTPTPSLSLNASDDSDKESMFSSRHNHATSDIVPVRPRKASIASVLMKKLKQKYKDRKIDTNWLSKSRLFLDSPNKAQLLPTPGLLKDGVGHTESSVKLTTFFRKDSVSRYRESFDEASININEFAPVLVPSRTRRSAKALLDAVTIKSVFGTELPSLKGAVKESISLSSDLKMDAGSKKRKDVENRCNKDWKERSGGRSSLPQSPVPSVVSQSSSTSSTVVDFSFNDDDSEIRSERSESRLQEYVIVQDLQKKRKLRKIRKFRSGFDYIRKKKKTKQDEDVSPAVKRRVTTRKHILWPEQNREIANEIRAWVINKGLGETILHKAARLQYHEVVIHCLESADCNVNSKDNAGYTPLHEACNRGNLDIAQALCAHKAHINATGFGGMRPLHEAAENGHIELARLLLAYGADPSLLTFGGQSWLALAGGDAHTESFVDQYTADLKGRRGTEWFFRGPARFFDLPEQGFHIFRSIPGPPSQKSSSKFHLLPSTATSTSTSVLPPVEVKKEPFDAADFVERTFKGVDVTDEGGSLVISDGKFGLGLMFETCDRPIPEVFWVEGQSGRFYILEDILSHLDLSFSELVRETRGGCVETIRLSREEISKSLRGLCVGAPLPSSLLGASSCLTLLKESPALLSLLSVDVTFLDQGYNILA